MAPRQPQAFAGVPILLKDLILQHRDLPEGKANEEAARILKESVKTIEPSRAAAMDKLGLTSMVELVRYAVRTRLAEA